VWSNGNVFADRNLSVKSESRLAGRVSGLVNFFSICSFFCGVRSLKCTSA